MTQHALSSLIVLKAKLCGARKWSSMATKQERGPSLSEARDEWPARNLGGKADNLRGTSESRLAVYDLQTGIEFKESCWWSPFQEDHRR